MPSNALAARYNSLIRHRGPDDPATIEAGREMKAGRIARYLDKVLSEAPELTVEQLDRLAAIIGAARPAAGGDTAGDAR